MHYVYILQSQKNESLYIGYTSDLHKRFIDHNEGRSRATKPFRPYKLILYEAFLRENESVRSAMRKFGPNFMKKIITRSGQEYQIEVGRFGFTNSNGCWFLIFNIESKNNNFNYNLNVHKGLINFADGWNLKGNRGVIRKRLEEIGLNRLKKYLENNNWGKCKRLEDGNYVEILTIRNLDY